MKVRITTVRVELPFQLGNFRRLGSRSRLLSPRGLRLTKTNGDEQTEKFVHHLEEPHTYLCCLCPITENISRDRVRHLLDK